MAALRFMSCKASIFIYLRQRFFPICKHRQCDRNGYGTENKQNNEISGNVDGQDRRCCHQSTGSAVYQRHVGMRPPADHHFLVKVLPVSLPYPFSSKDPQQQCKYSIKNEGPKKKDTDHYIKAAGSRPVYDADHGNRGECESYKSAPDIAHKDPCRLPVLQKKANARPY